jgi:16S rRNA (uracil1498-N3)-methyltransferase
VEAFDADRAVVTGEAAHHLGRVLRAEPGQLYELSDGRSVRLGKIEVSGRDRVEFVLLEPLPVPFSSLEKTLLLALVKFDAFEWALEKATELGVNRIVPLAAARSEKGLLAAAAKRARRWEKIVFESSQQSRRVRLPVIEPVKKLAPAFESETAGLRVLLSERAEARPLREIFRDSAPHSVALAVGPEGGWTDQELATARQAGFREASLGPLILRAETAVTAALAAANYALDA